MTRTTSVATTLAAYLGAAAAILTIAPHSTKPPTLPAWQAAAAGVGVAALVYGLLARRPPPLRLPVPRVRRLALPVVLVAGCEEIVWRRGALGAAALAVGLPAAWLLSTLGFSLRHVRRGRTVTLGPHLLLGGAFGAVFVGTGRLVAAVVAHVVYDLFVLAAYTERRR